MTTFAALTTKPRSLKASEIPLLARRNLGLLRQDGAAKSAPIGTPEVCAEALRAALWALSRDGTEAVYVLRLLNAARRLAQPALSSVFADDVMDDALRTALSELETLGDVATLPRGCRLPAPLRVVPLQVAKRWLLLGGLPSHKLSDAVRDRLEYIGTARFFLDNPAQFLPLPQQPESQWRSLPRQNLRDWTLEVLHRTVLKPFEDESVEWEGYAVGVPKLNEGSHSFQWGRWTPKLSALPNGCYLLRRKLRFGPTDHRIAQLQHGQVTTTGAPDWGEGDVRRFLYGLDTLAECPVAVRMRRERHQVIFRLSNELPHSENRLFLALGALHMVKPEQYYPRDWIIGADHAPQAESALRELGVWLEEVNSFGGVRNDSDC